MTSTDGRVSPVVVASLLVGLGADEDCVGAASLIVARRGTAEDDVVEASPEALRLAAAAQRALGARWIAGGRTPARHAIEAVRALGGESRALLVAVVITLARLRASAHDGERGRALALESLGVWAPVAALLGVRPLQRELEDLAFKIADRAAYEAVARFVAKTREGRDRALAAARTALAAALADGAVEAEVTGRAKHLWSIHQKLRARRGREPTLHDLFGLRVMVEDEAACYEALGVVHAAFDPVPERFKDYVARPKANGYQSLHTVVVVPLASEERVEIQIRSRAMHVRAEHGAAAHVRYKHPSSADTGSLEERWIYPLTPGGEVRRLPRGATPLDFAYAIHTAIGRGCSGAKIGGKLVPLGTPLATGDVVEILHSARSRPTEGQLGRVRTARARNRIRAVLPRGRTTSSVNRSP
jgi:GTP diphosphokinase / guanosine-3',5'-bis(diphosphate) 3'-diphosphatase